MTAWLSIDAPFFSSLVLASTVAERARERRRAAGRPSWRDVERAAATLREDTAWSIVTMCVCCCSSCCFTVGVRSIDQEGEQVETRETARERRVFFFGVGVGAHGATGRGRRGALCASALFFVRRPLKRSSADSAFPPFWDSGIANMHTSP